MMNESDDESTKKGKSQGQGEHGADPQRRAAGQPEGPAGEAAPSAAGEPAADSGASRPSDQPAGEAPAKSGEAESGDEPAAAGAPAADADAETGVSVFKDSGSFFRDQVARTLAEQGFDLREDGTWGSESPEPSKDRGDAGSGVAGDQPTGATGAKSPAAGSSEQAAAGAGRGENDDRGSGAAAASSAETEKAASPEGPSTAASGAGDTEGEPRSWFTPRVSSRSESAEPGPADAESDGRQGEREQSGGGDPTGAAASESVSAKESTQPDPGAAYAEGRWRPGRHESSAGSAAAGEPAEPTRADGARTAGADRDGGGARPVVGDSSAADTAESASGPGQPERATGPAQSWAAGAGAGAAAGAAGAHSGPAYGVGEGAGEGTGGTASSAGRGSGPSDSQGASSEATGPGPAESGSGDTGTGRDAWHGGDRVTGDGPRTSRYPGAGASYGAAASAGADAGSDSDEGSRTSRFPAADSASETGGDTGTGPDSGSGAAPAPGPRTGTGTGSGTGAGTGTGAGSGTGAGAASAAGAAAGASYGVPPAAPSAPTASTPSTASTASHGAEGAAGGPATQSFGPEAHSPSGPSGPPGPGGPGAPSGPSGPSGPTRPPGRGGPPGGKGGKPKSGAKKPLWWRISRAALITCGVLAVIMLGGFGIAYATIQVPDVAKEEAVNQGSTFYYADGETQFAERGVDREPVDYDQIPKEVQEAVISAEDRGYWDSPGVSITGTIRAVWFTVTGQQVQGGSTITQQFVRNYFEGISREQTITRKLKEIIIALKVDQSPDMDKQWVMEQYLNTIYFGRNAYGIQSAAQAYYHKDVGELNGAESAFLAAAIQQPTLYGQADEGYTDDMKGRWEYVVNGMVEEGSISKAEADSMEFPKPKAERPANSTDLSGFKGYMLQQAMQELKDLGYSEDNINRGGYKVVTTFDQQTMKMAKQAVEDTVDVDTLPEGVRAGLTAIDPSTGEVVGFYGGKNYLESQYDNAFDGAAQAGSAFKPYVLATALEQGYSLNSQVNGNSPISVAGSQISNYDHSSHGPTTLVEATRMSLNTGYVQLAQEVGEENVRKTANDVGIPKSMITDNQVVPTIALGVSNVRPVDQATGFATFANGGKHVETHVVRKIVNKQGENERPEPKTTQAISEQTANNVSYALQQVVQGGTGSSAALPGRPAAGKTGTTDNSVAAWFVGFTPQLSTAVGVYNGNNQPFSVPGWGSLSGGTLPAAIWNNFMTRAMEGKEVKQFPEPTFEGQVHDLAPDPPPTQEESAPDEPSTPTGRPEEPETPTAPPPDQPEIPTGPPAPPEDTPPPPSFPEWPPDNGGGEEQQQEGESGM